MQFTLEVSKSAERVFAPLRVVQHVGNWPVLRFMERTRVRKLSRAAMRYLSASHAAQSRPFASGAPPTTIARNQIETDRFVGAAMGSVPIPEFSSPDNIRRIIASTIAT